MKVRLTTDRAGISRYDAAGEVIELSRREAMALIASGQAEKLSASEEGAANTETINHGDS